MSSTKRVFVATGHNRPFHRLLGLVEPLARDPRIELFTQKGSAAEAFPGLPGLAFLDKAEFERRMDWADVIVTQAGAGAISDARRVGHLPIVVPRRAALGEHIDDHQWQMAEVLSQAKLVYLLRDGEDLGQLVWMHAGRRIARAATQMPLIEALRRDLSRHDSTPLRAQGVATAVRALLDRMRRLPGAAAK